MEAGEQITVTEVIVGGTFTVTVALPDFVESCVDVAVIIALPVPVGVKTRRGYCSARCCPIHSGTVRSGTCHSRRAGGGLCGENRRRRTDYRDGRDRRREDNSH